MPEQNLTIQVYNTEVLKPDLFERTEPFQPEACLDPAWM